MKPSASRVIRSLSVATLSVVALAACTGPMAERMSDIELSDEPLTGKFVHVDFRAVDGYSGDIRLLAGIRDDGSLTGVRVVAHRETPGLGDKIELDPDFLAKLLLEETAREMTRLEQDRPDLYGEIRSAFGMLR